MNVGAQIVEKQFVGWGVDVSKAICKLNRDTGDTVGPIAKILWVDPHPGNNIGLQYAFGQLGMLVVAIQDETDIDEAFRTAGGFDVVITHMGDDNAGFRVVEAIRKHYRSTSVIIYSATYGPQFEKEHKQPEAPVVSVTYHSRRFQSSCRHSS